MLWTFSQWHLLVGRRRRSQVDRLIVDTQRQRQEKISWGLESQRWDTMCRGWTLSLSSCHRVAQFSSWVFIMDDSAFLDKFLGSLAKDLTQSGWLAPKLDLQDYQARDLHTSRELTRTSLLCSTLSMINPTLLLIRHWRNGSKRSHNLDLMFNSWAKPSGTYSQESPNVLIIQ